MGGEEVNGAAVGVVRGALVALVVILKTGRLARASRHFVRSYFQVLRFPSSLPMIAGNTVFAK